MFFQITKAATPLTGCRRQLILRSLSSSTNNIQIEVDNKTGFATLSMNRPPVNSRYVARLGHSPAGGCVLATCCEYRVMLPNFTIGLNEAKFGLVPPPVVRVSFKNVLPLRIAELALCQGKLFTSNEALNIGLIDELANTKEEGYEKCVKFLQTFKKVDPVARSLTKQQFRGKDLDDLRQGKQKDLEDFVEHVTQDEIQMRLGVYLEQLHNRKKK